MDETTVVSKPRYSRNEKIVRIIAIIGIILSTVVGIMMFPLGKTTGGIVILATSFVSAFLMCGFVVRGIKNRFSLHKYKRFIVAGFYAFIMILSMLTAALMSYFSSYPLEDLAIEAIEFTQDAIEKKDPDIQNIRSDLFEYFESGDSYFFAIETDFEHVGTGGAISKRSTTTYLKVNKYTSTITVIESLQYEATKANR